MTRRGKPVPLVVKYAVRSVLAFCLVTAVRGDVIFVPLGGGNLEVRVGFIKFDYGQYQPKLEMRIVNHTASAWKSLKLRIDAGYVCEGEPKQYSMQVSTHVGWAADQAVSQDFADLVIPLVGKVDKCETKIIRASLISADSLSGLHIEQPDGLPVEMTGDLTALQQKLATEAQKRQRDEEARARAEQQARDADRAKIAESERKREEGYRAAHVADVARLSRSGPDSIQTVISRLIAGGGRKEKGEFETSGHFEAAQAALLKANSGRYIFLKDVTPGATDFSYDADSGTMRGYLEEGSSRLTDEPSGSRTITLKSIPTGSRRYPAKNAFNASVVVIASTFDDFEIAMTDEPRRLNSPIHMEFAISPERARMLKPFLRFALFGTLADAHVYKDSLDTEAKFDDPHELHVTRLILLMNIEQIDVVDSRTGKVVFSPVP